MQQRAPMNARLEQLINCAHYSRLFNRRMIPTTRRLITKTSRQSQATWWSHWLVCDTDSRLKTKAAQKQLCQTHNRQQRQKAQMNLNEIIITNQTTERSLVTSSCAATFRQPQLSQQITSVTLKSTIKHFFFYFLLWLAGVGLPQIEAECLRKPTN